MGDLFSRTGESYPFIFCIYIVPGSDNDEFAAYFPEFTEADFAQIDAAEVSGKHLPKVTIAYETLDVVGPSSHPISPRKRPGSPGSPLDSFRSHGTLSVTDLASPAWYISQLTVGIPSHTPQLTGVRYSLNTVFEGSDRGHYINDPKFLGLLLGKK